MSDEIVRRLPEWFVGRMRAWMQFRQQSGAYSVASSWPSDGPMGDRGGFGPRYWRMLGSVHDTTVAIDELPGRYRQAVVQYWMADGSGVSLRALARHRQVDNHTFTTWLRKGHALLFLAFRAQARRRRAQHQAEGGLVRAIA